MKQDNLTNQNLNILHNCNQLNSLYDMEVYIIMKDEKIRRAK